MEWQIIIYLSTGLALGVGLTLFYQRYRKPRSVQQLDAEYKKLQEDVMEHFVTTANLVNDMTDSYKAVFDHLNAGANKLVDNTELRERLPHEDQRVITLSRIGQPEARSETAAAAQSSTREGAENGSHQATEEDLEPPRF